MLLLLFLRDLNDKFIAIFLVLHSTLTWNEQELFKGIPKIFLYLYAGALTPKYAWHVSMHICVCIYVYVLRPMCIKNDTRD